MDFYRIQMHIEIRNSYTKTQKHYEALNFESFDNLIKQQSLNLL